ncbi:glyoxalase [Tardiphaga sp. 42S5]|uniref:glyoxalase n=1 Tax=Tardiphaga sp. 42S5 TaxID=1404799 RepID=UPI002A5A1440|nr:glyoxalase [Tardiphaga sp. 42S5]WPO42879.1 glyoxalase [Tardiphaga sp. 42S5]
MRFLRFTAVAVSIALLSTVTQAAWSREAPAKPDFAVGAQYDTTHVYVAPDEVNGFVESFIATFGGKSTKQVIATVTPTPSSTTSQLLLTPAGSVSVFGFKTPIPYPFGHERTGYLVTDIDAAVKAAQGAGADVLVKTFPDPIGRDVVVQWPGGINMQLYWHTTAPSYPELQTIPENRVYVPASRADQFVKSFVAFSKGSVVSDTAKAPGIEIGRPNDTYRRIRVTSKFGKMTVLVTDGVLPYPYGHELTGYEVPSLDETLAKAKTAGAAVLVEPYVADARRAALVKFPGGYVAEIHSAVGK